MINDDKHKGEVNDNKVHNHLQQQAWGEEECHNVNNNAVSLRWGRMRGRRKTQY